MGATRIFILSMLVAVVEGECHCMTSCATFPDAPCPSVDDHPCERGWFGPYCQMQNIALDRPTTQSSTYTNDYGTYPSSLAVDGRATNDFASRPFTCTHTEANDKPNWEVDLGGRVNITRIKLYLRNSTVNPGRNDGMKIMVGNQECHQWHVRPPVTADVTCGETLQGNRVSISVRSRFLTLCEVQIFSCSVGWFGDECDKQCNCLNDDVCDKLSGHCPGGCTVGFRGTDCLTPCVDRRFGLNCRSICGNCLNNAVCDKTTGRCPTRCKPGWTGLTCLQPCVDHTFGVNCGNVCGNCLNNAVCDTTTGRCPTGCKPGWTGLTCLQPCVDHTFGVNCGNVCGNCLNNAVCDKTTGRCPTGCKPGWTGLTCLQPCVDHTFGVNCGNVCGNCLNNAVCDKTTGRCPTGCKPGWTGLTCLQPCVDHTFGVNCGNVCGNCLNNAVCDKTTGRCPTGCKPGWTGLTCLQPCTSGDNGIKFPGTVSSCTSSDTDIIVQYVQVGIMSACTGSACNDGQYGDRCNSTCGHCHNSRACNKSIGHCQNGCQGNYEEPFCQTCNDGHYGDRCSLRCGHCHNTTVCNKTTGHCPQGICQGKYLAPLCQDYNTDVCVPLAVTVTPYIIIVVIVVVAGVLFVVRKRISFCAKTTSDPEPRYAGFEPKPEADYTEFSFRAHYDSPDAKVYENEEKQAGDDHIYIYPSDDNNR